MSFSDQNLSGVRRRCCCRRRRCCKLFTFLSSSPEPTKLASILRWRKFKFVQIKVHTLFQGESLGELRELRNSETHWRNLKVFSSRIAGPISSKFGTKHAWVVGIQIRSTEDPRSFSREDKFEIVEKHWLN